MSKTQSRHLRTVLGVGLTATISVAIIYGIVNAGSLQPSASPAATMYTLSDIYTRLTTNATATEGNHPFSPSASPASSMYTLTQVYNAIPTIDANMVASSTTYLGIKGTLLGNMFNGTGQGFAGGSQPNGGVDDYNNAGSPPSDRYSKGWTQCTSGNSYCGTNDSGADAKDNSTGLVWSMPCYGLGCSSFSDITPTSYTWGSSGANNNSRTASQLCSDHSGWFLPHQKQLMQAYIDGSYGNLEASGVDRYYWSGTTLSYITSYAWNFNLSYGDTNYDAKTGDRFVRCVRPAN
jgi:hypothetical protein